MTTSTQHEQVAAALTELAAHVRVRDQDLVPQGETREQLLAAFPALVPFVPAGYAEVWAVLDWDHRLPSQQLVLRVFAVYGDTGRTELQETRAAVDTRIQADNLYPEFDLPDYGDVAGDELYVATYDPHKHELGEIQFSSTWRRQVAPGQLDVAHSVLEQSPAYREALASRSDDTLGKAMLVGWVPPCIAHADAWALEFWLLMRFDGATGEANVFIVDPESGKLTRQYMAEVQAS